MIRLHLNNVEAYALSLIIRPNDFEELRAISISDPVITFRRMATMVQIRLNGEGRVMMN